MKKISMLFVAIFMVVAMVGCGKKSPVGNWQTTFDASAVMIREMGQELEGMPSGFNITLVMEFSEDGNVKMYCDKAASEGPCNQWLDEVMDVMVESLYTQLETEQGLDRATVDEMFPNYYGMSIKDYVQTIRNAMDLDTMLDAFENTGTYTYNKDCEIFINGEDKCDMTFALEKDTMTLTIADEEEWPEGVPNPLVMTAR